MGETWECPGCDIHVSLSAGREMVEAVLAINGRIRVLDWTVHAAVVPSRRGSDEIREKLYSGDPLDGIIHECVVAGPTLPAD
jgi:hypothetical protein